MTYTVKRMAEFMCRQSVADNRVCRASGIRNAVPDAHRSGEGISMKDCRERPSSGPYGRRIPGVYEVQGPAVTPYMVPQDCGMHMQTKWLEIVRRTSLDNTDRGEEAAV